MANSLLVIGGVFGSNDGLLLSLVIGLAAGLLAQLLTPGRGFGIITSILLGIAGGWIGNKLFKGLLSFTDSPIVNQIVCAAAGAIILVVIINLIAGRDKNDKTRYRA